MYKRPVATEWLQTVLLAFHINSTPIWRLGNFASGESSIDYIRPFKYNLGLPGVMSFHMVPHLPWLVAMVAKFFMCK